MAQCTCEGNRQRIWCNPGMVLGRDQCETGKRSSPSLVRRRQFLPLQSPPALVGARSGVVRPLTVLGLLCLSCATGQIGGEVGEHEHNPSIDVYGACEVTDEVPVEPTD